jgi:hypothetical protein
MLPKTSLAVAAALFFALALNMEAAPDSASASPKPVATASPAKPVSITQIFPEKVGDFARLSVQPNNAGLYNDVVDSAVAKYAVGPTEITWTATAFTTPEGAFANLETTVASAEKEGAKIQMSVKNTDGKMRFAALEEKRGWAYYWVSKKNRNLFFVVSGRTMAAAKKFVELQQNW